MFLYIVNDGKSKKKIHNKQSSFIRNIAILLMKNEHIKKIKTKSGNISFNSPSYSKM